MLTTVLTSVLTALACTSAPSAEFEMSSQQGTVPHDVQFTPVEESGDVSYLWEFGDGNTSTDSSPTHTYQDAGDFIVTLSASRGDSTSVFERAVRLEAGEAGWVTVEPPSLTLESGERTLLRPSAFDSLGNPVRDAEFIWDADDNVGSVLEDGTFVAGPQVGNFSDAVTVSYERLGKTVSVEVPVEIVYGRLDSIVVEPSIIDTRVNSRIDFTVLARDKQGHVLPEPEIDWQLLRPGVDEILAGGEFRAGVVPTDREQELLRVRVSVGDQTTTQMISGNISAGILDRVDVSASPDQVPVGSPVELTAQGLDRFGNLVELDSVEWQLVSDDFGEVTAEGVFTPSGAAVSATGPVITAIGELERVRSFVGVELDVLPGIAAEIVINPLSDSIPVGAGNPFSAFVIDDFGNVIDGIDITWSATSGGTVTETGVFVAGFETGEFPGAITASIPAGTSGNPTELSASADVLIRDRSSDTLAVEVSNATDSGIILIDLTTGAISSLSEELDTDNGIELSPAWWPDGKRLAFASDVTGTLQVYDIEFDTGEVRQLIDIPEGSSMPSISPDGTKIAFVVTVESNWQLYVADLPVPDEEGNITPITQEAATKLSVDDDVQHLLPFWAPDGESIVFTVSRSLSDVNMAVVSTDGSSAPEALGETGLSGFGWSDDGEFILSIDNQNEGGQSLIVIGADNGELAGFVPLPFQAFLATWSPDSSEVAVIDRVTGALWLLDSDGSSLRQAVDRSFVPRRVAWSPVPIDAEAVLAEQESELSEEPGDGAEGENEPPLQ